MDRNEKLNLSASEEYGYCFKQGLFVRLYEQSLFWFVTHIKPLKPMLERVKDGEPIAYGGLPVSSFEKLVGESILHAHLTDNGWKWSYAAQTQGNREDFAGFSTWRERAIHSASVISAKASGLVIPAKAGIQKDGLDPRLRGGDKVGSRHDEEKDRDILHEIRAFNLAGSTPIQTMSAVADWQEYLQAGSLACAEE